ncbi:MULTISPECIES: FkbM family methyltransferase [Prochlorococcus]|uniref:FkbM family methyltransferase n=1 Tax=Prochlorococcus TaxID=1218 RepID=UPI000564C11C|nr:MULTISPECIES: FkbM family methyltransferase [Prochlorococcus]
MYKYALNISSYKPDLIGYLYDEITWSVLIDGEYERENILTALEFLRNKNVNFHLFVDVGANIGTTTLSVNTLFSNVIAIEANPKTFAVLQLNTSDIKNVELINKAVSNLKSNREMYFHDAGYAGATLVENDYGANLARNKINVDVTTLDDILSDISSKSIIIKMDIEGEELNALIGAKRVVDLLRPIFILEINKREIENGTSATFDYLKKLGYSFYNVQRNYSGRNPLLRIILNSKGPKIIKVDYLIKRYRMYPNLICIPNEIINC